MLKDKIRAREAREPGMGLKDRLAKIKQERECQHEDWKRRKDLWVMEVKTLYQQVAGWLADLMDEGFVKMGFSTKTLTEDFVGTYEIDVLELDLDVCPPIVFEPVGRNIIGFLGRIDIYIKGHETERRMLLQVEGEDGSAHWELWKNIDKKEMVPFTGESLEKLLEYWIDAWS
jgi:hypothetical protein